MEMELLNTIVNLLVNNGVAVAILIYFCIRDWKFQNTLIETLTTIKEMLKENERGKEKDD